MIVWTKLSLNVFSFSPFGIFKKVAVELFDSLVFDLKFKGDDIKLDQLWLFRGELCVGTMTVFLILKIRLDKSTIILFCLCECCIERSQPSILTISLQCWI